MRTIFFLKKSKLAAAIGHLPYKALHSCRYFNIYYWRINPETKSGDAGIKTPTFQIYEAINNTTIEITSFYKLFICT